MSHSLPTLQSNCWCGTFAINPKTVRKSAISSISFFLTCAGIDTDMAVAFPRRPLEEKSGGNRQRLPGFGWPTLAPAQAILPDVEPQRGPLVVRGIGFA